MSQISSQGLDPDWVSLSIVRFSHNTSPYGTRTYTWNHVNTRGDLDFVVRNARYFDEQGNHGTRVIMKVSAGADEMETQDLSDLARYCNLFDPSTGAEHPVEIAIRSPFIAMRYPKTVNTVRRFQIKFRSHKDYQKVLTILQDLGLPITNRETTTPATGNPPPPPSPAPSNTASTTSSSTLLRPSSATDLPVLASSAVKSDFRIPAQPESAISEDKVRFSDQPRVTTTFPTPFQNPGVASNHAISRVNSLQGPASQVSQFYSPVEQEPRNLSLQIPVHAKPEMPRTSLYVDQSQNIQQMNSIQHSTPTASLSTSLFSVPLSIPSVPYADNREPSSFTTMAQPNPHRPASVPSSSTVGTSPSLLRSTSTLSLPPKRELPFARLAESEKARQSFTPIPPPKLSSFTPVILPPPKSANTTGDKLSTPASKPPPKKRAAQRKATVKAGDDKTIEKLNPDHHVIAEPDTVSEEPSPLAAKSAAVRPSSDPLGLVSKAAAPARKRTATPAIRPPSTNKRPKMTDQATQTESLDLHDAHNVARSETASKPTAIPTSAPPDVYLQSIDDFVFKHKSRPAPKEIWETPGWADLDDVYRQGLVDNFICENLENPQFLKLCEDMDTAWRRIGLGL